MTCRLRDMPGEWGHRGWVRVLGEWWKTGWAHCEEHKKEFGFDPVGDVEPEAFRQGNGMIVTGRLFPWGNALRP